MADRAGDVTRLRPRFAPWLIALGAGYLLLVGWGAVSLATAPAVTGLLEPGRWATGDGFSPTESRPPPWDERPGTTLDPWRGSPDEGGEAVLISEPFPTPRVVIVPYQLANREPIPVFDPRTEASAELVLDCETGPGKLSLPIAETNDRMSESVASVPGEFCTDGHVRVIARVEHPFYLMVGLPNGADAGFMATRRLPAHLFRHAVIFSGIAAIGLAAALLAPRRRGEGPVAAASMLGIGAVSMLGFFVYAGSPRLGRGLTLVVLGGSVGLIAYRTVRHRMITATALRRMAEPLAAWFLLSLFVVLLLHAVDTGAGPWQANSRFRPAWWSSDNNLPMEVSEGIYRGHDIESLGSGPWKVSDRPPLQSGAGAVLRPLVRVTAPSGVAGSDLAYFHHTLGIVLNSLWVVAAIETMRAVGWGSRRRLAACAVVALSPIAIFNGAYVWPKLLAAAFAIMAVAVLVESRGPRHHLLVPAALGALSLLSHGGTVFFLLALGVWVVVRLRPRWVELAMGLALGAAVLAPWMIWQRVVDPPGNALVKYTFAGTFGFGEDDTGLLETVVDAYADLGLDGWLELRKEGTEEVLGFGLGLRDEGLEWADLSRLRSHVFTAPALALLGPAALIVAVSRRRGDRHARFLVLLGLGALAANVVVFWGPQIVPHLSYATLVVLVVGSATGIVTIWGRWGQLLVATSIALTAYVWIIDPLSSPWPVDPPTTAVALGLAVAMAVLVPGLGSRDDGGTGSRLAPGVDGGSVA